MFNFLGKFLKKTGKGALNKIKKTPNTIKNLVTNPVKFVGKSLTFGLKNSFSFVSKLKKRRDKRRKSKSEGGTLGWLDENANIIAHGANVNKDLIEMIQNKAKLVERLYAGAEKILQGKSNANIRESELARDINERPKILSGDTRSELQDKLKYLDKELKNAGIGKVKSRHIINGTEGMELLYESSLDLAYDTYMDNWKTRFFGSDEIISNGEALDEEGRTDLWKQIEEDRDVGWFVEALSRDLNNDK